MKPQAQTETTSLVRVSLAIACLAVALQLVMFPFRGAFPLDDTYIHLQYAKRLAVEGLLAFNAGEPSLGTTSLVWVTVLACLRAIGIGEETAALLLNSLALAALVILTPLCVSRSLRPYSLTPWQRRSAVLWPALMIALNGNMLWHAASGMETLAVLAATLTVILVWQVRGFDLLTGLLVGILLWIRPTTVTVLATLACLELLRGKAHRASGVAVAAAFGAAQLWFIHHITGLWEPTTSIGKKLTYVQSGLDLADMRNFVWAFVRFHMHLPQIIVLAAVLCGIAAIAYSSCEIRLRRTVQRSLRPHNLGVTALCLSCALEFALYVLEFRAMHHQNRYLQAVPLSLIVLFAAGSRYLARAGFWRLWQGVASGLLLLSAYSLGQWSVILKDNATLISTVHMKVAEWVKEHTKQDARIAAPDIGVLGYMSDRYVIDMLGLVDTRAHPCLKEKNCSEYVRAQNADYFVSLRTPDIDPAWLKLFSAEATGNPRLKQKVVAAFKSPVISYPTINHPAEALISEVEGWFEENQDGFRNLFSYDGAPYTPYGLPVSPGLTLVGYDLRPRTLTRVSGLVDTLHLTLLWMRTGDLHGSPPVAFSLLDQSDGGTWMQKPIAPGHGSYSPDKWPEGQIIEETHVIQIPWSFNIGSYDAVLSIGDGRHVSGTYFSPFESESTVMLPRVQILDSGLRAIHHRLPMNWSLR